MGIVPKFIGSFMFEYTIFISVKSFVKRRYFSVFEIVLGLSLCTILFWRFQGKIIRSILVLAMIAYIAVPAYFIFVINHHLLKWVRNETAIYGFNAANEVVFCCRLNFVSS